VTTPPGGIPRYDAGRYAGSPGKSWSVTG